VSYTKRELCECAHAALRQRRSGYPDLVRSGRMKSRVADEQIAKMEAIYRVLIKLDDKEIERAQG